MTHDSEPTDAGGAPERPALSSHVENWPDERKMGMGLLSLVPLALLFLTLLVGLVALTTGGAWGLVPILAYTQVGATFITLLLFMHLMAGHELLTPRGKLAWSFYFLLLAPVAVPHFWFLHVWLDIGRNQATHHVTVRELLPPVPA